MSDGNALSAGDDGPRPLSCKAGEVSAEVFEQYRIPTYHEASYKPFVISALSSLPPAVPSILPLPITCTASGRMDAFKLLVKSHHNDTTFELRVIPGKEDNVTVVSGSFELEHAEEHGGMLEVKVWGV